MKESRPESGHLPLPIETLDHFQGIELPSYQTPVSSGLDLRAAVVDALHLAPGERMLIPTGIKIAIPSGFEGQIRPRSGLAIRLGLGLVNAPGTH